YLAGGVPERSTWQAQAPDIQAMAHRYHVAPRLGEVLLPLLCATRRTVLLGDDSDRVRPLEWDDGPPWNLCVHVTDDPPGQNWLLEGGLRRSDDSLPLTEATLLVPGGFAFIRNRVSRLHDFGAFDWVGLFRSEGTIKVPREEGGELIDRLLDM